MQTCVGCGKNAPETDTNYTLISAQFGWRLTRVKRGDGSIALEWRCPTCWRDYKRTKAPHATGDGTELPVESPSSSGLGPRDNAARSRPTVTPAVQEPADPAGPRRPPGRTSR